MSRPELVSIAKAMHAAHHPGLTSRPASDLITWTVRFPTQPTREQLDAIAVPADAVYHCGSLEAGTYDQLWHYVRSVAAPSGSTCERCERFAS